MKSSVDMFEPAAGGRYRDAYFSLLDRMQKLESTSLVAVELDIPGAVTSAVRALPGLRALRAELAYDLSLVDLARFDALEACTLALGYAHALYAAAAAPFDAREALWTAAVSMRASLAADVAQLADAGVDDGEVLIELRGALGARNLVWDLLVLAGVLRSHWNAQEAVTLTPAAELSLAENLADRLLLGLQARAPGTEPVHLADTRQRAFTLFVTTYEHVRRAISLQWQEPEANAILPAMLSSNDAADPRPTVDTR